jgi:hypothetical protein
MSTGFHQHLATLTDRLTASEEATKVQFAAMQEQISALQVASSAAPTFADVAAAAASQTRPSPTSSTSRPTTSGPAEDCLVFIRGFPVAQPGIVLKEYAAEALGILPSLEASAVRVRTSPADTQLSLVFPLPSLASAFVEEYRSRKFVFRDEDGVDHPLSCRTGKPIGLRRRGGLIRPVYALLVDVLLRTRGYTTASISQNSKIRNGVPTTEFYALKGKTLRPLFTLTYKGSDDAMLISGLIDPVEGSPINQQDIDALRSLATSA